LEEAVSTQPIAEQLKESVRAREAAPRAIAVSLLGPLTSLAGAVWAIVQPYRVTLLHPHGESFWSLVVEAPVFVIVAGALFHLLVARPLVRDLEERG
jgi:hypothetical protein